jgi:hypothetical protein
MLVAVSSRLRVVERLELLCRSRPRGRLTGPAIQNWRKANARKGAAREGASQGACRLLAHGAASADPQGYMRNSEHQGLHCDVGTFRVLARHRHRAPITGVSP